MFLEPIRIHRPDMQAEIQQLIDIICHETKGNSFPIIELVRVLGVNISEELRVQLSERGELLITDEHLENEGPEVNKIITLFGFGVNLHMPQRLLGGITRFSNSFQLAFEPEHSVVVSKFLFNVELRHLDLSTERVFIDFSGAQDIFIDFD